MGLTWQAGGPIFVSPDRCCLPKKAFAIGCLSAAGPGQSPPVALKLSKARPSDGADARMRRGGYQQDSDGAEQSPNKQPACSTLRLSATCARPIPKYQKTPILNKRPDLLVVGGKFMQPAWTSFNRPKAPTTHRHRDFRRPTIARDAISGALGP
jgi:hypothetical protein